MCLYRGENPMCSEKSNGGGSLVTRGSLVNIDSTVRYMYRPVRYDTVRYGTGTGTAVFNIEFIQWPDPFSKYLFSQKNLYYEQGCRWGGRIS